MCPKALWSVAVTDTALVDQVVLSADEEQRRRQRFPLGASIEFEDLEVHARAGVLDRLRAAEPVSWVPALGGWLVTDHALARRVLGARDEFTVWARPNLVRASLGVMMLASDPPEHDRQRQPFDGPFRQRAVRERFQAPIVERAHHLLDELAPLGECELTDTFAAPFAISVAGDILGLSLDVAHVQGLYEAFAGAMVYDGDAAPQLAADAARRSLDEVLHAELARVRRSPDASVTSAVAVGGSGGLDDDEIVAQLRVILFGAIETVESMIVNTVTLLLQHPHELSAVRADPDLLPNAIEEGMRVIPPVAFMERWTARDVVVGAVELGPGEFVGVSSLAAGRDPHVFGDPLRFDVRRANARHHLAFSFGVHHCLGISMARLQGAVALAAILERLHGLEIVDAPDPRGFAFRRPATLTLRWTA